MPLQCGDTVLLQCLHTVLLHCLGTVLLQCRHTVLLQCLDIVCLDAVLLQRLDAVLLQWLGNALLQRLDTTLLQCLDTVLLIGLGLQQWLTSRMWFEKLAIAAVSCHCNIWCYHSMLPVTARKHWPARCDTSKWILQLCAHGFICQQQACCTPHCTLWHLFQCHFA